MTMARPRASSIDSGGATPPAERPERSLQPVAAAPEPGVMSSQVVQSGDGCELADGGVGPLVVGRSLRATSVEEVQPPRSGRSEAGVADRSSRPTATERDRTRGTQDPAPAPQTTPGAVPITDRLGLTACTVHAVLVRRRANRLSHLDRAGGEPIRPLRTRTARRPAARRGQGARQRARRRRPALPRPPARRPDRNATTGKPRDAYYNQTIGTAFVLR
jgi:hypothetical protein